MVCTPASVLLCSSDNREYLQGKIQGGGGGGGLWGLKPSPFIFRLYLINMLSIIMKFCLSIIM